MGDPELHRREIPLAVPCLGNSEIEAVTAALRSGWISTVSPDVERFERAFASELGVTHAVATVSGTAALHMALLAVGVLPDDEVLLPALTFVAPANAVRHAGAWPVLIDVDPVTAQLDAGATLAFLRTRCEPGPRGLVNRASGRRIAALMPVHVLGHACDLAELVAFAHEHGVCSVTSAASRSTATS
jgi:perosamine synthetase